ncbi:MAG: ATP-grasp domain-containing protein [Treponema succinifaciens]|nr:MAG: ATP-grasp domain-containing protein [Treponema succinifaciens]
MNASNKILMRECFKKNKIPSPDFFEADENYINLFQKNKTPEIHFPKVVKPVDNMGARGCRLVRNKDEFLPALKRRCLFFSRTKKAIVEDFMEGPEFSIDALVVNGKVIIAGFADRHIFLSRIFVELGHSMPSEISEKLKNRKL